jgi:D-amino-acid dehydrogenase
MSDQQMSKPRRVTVVGAGVVGASCAFELAERGVEVTIIDAGQVGGGASEGNAGWIVPFLSTPRAAPGAVGDAARSMIRRDGPGRVRPHLELGFFTWILRFLRASRPAQNRKGAMALQRLASSAIASIDRLADLGVSFEEHRDGLAVVALRSSTIDQYVRLIDTMSALGYQGASTILRGSEVREFDPAIHRDAVGVVHLHTERHVRPETLTAGLVEAAKARGAKLYEHQPVHRITSSGSGWLVEAGDGLLLESDQVVVAAGWESRKLLADVGVSVPLEAARGTSLTVRGTGLAPRHPLKLAESMVACSPFDGGLRLSGTFDVGARGTTVNEDRLRRAVVSQGLRYLDDWRPDSADIERRGWVGHRPMTPDDLPVIGPVPGRPGLYTSTGHGTLGVTLGPATGRLVAEEIVNGVPQHVLAPFRITRFGRTGR